MKILSPQAIVVGLETVNLDDFPDLKVIGCNMTGTEHLPWDEINKRGIKVVSLKEYPKFLKEITSTAEHTIGLIISILRNYRIALNPPYQDREIYKGFVMRDKKLGLIGGRGRIGKQVKKMAEGLGMKVQTHDENDSRKYLNFLLQDSDIVSIHIPLPGNEGFFTKEMFGLMKPTAYLLNTSRNGVIEEGALLWALQNGIIKGAGIDFIDDEDLVEYNRTQNNLILTNHIGGITHEDRKKTEDFIINEVTKWLSK